MANKFQRRIQLTRPRINLIKQTPKFLSLFLPKPSSELLKILNPFSIEDKSMGSILGPVSWWHVKCTFLFYSSFLLKGLQSSFCLFIIIPNTHCQHPCHNNVWVIVRHFRCLAHIYICLFGLPLVEWWILYTQTFAYTIIICLRNPIPWPVGNMNYQNSGTQIKLGVNYVLESSKITTTHSTWPNIRCIYRQLASTEQDYWKSK